VVAAFFWLFPGSGDTRFIGWGWLLGQFILTALLSLVLANATQDIPKALRNIAIAVVGFSIMTVAHDTLPLSSVIWLGIVLAVASGLVGLALLLRLYMTFRNLGAETER
jgi:hydrogenase/urease accessory protein HupE